MRNILIIKIIALLFFGCAPKSDDGILEISMLNNEIRISSKRDVLDGPCKYSCAEIKYSLINGSNKNILLYNFKRYMEFASMTKEEYCDSLYESVLKTTFVFSETMMQRRSADGVRDSLEKNPEAIKRTYDMAETWFRNARVTVKAHETMEFSETVNFREFYFKPGIYYIQLLYMQNYIPEDLDPSVVEADLKEHDATLFIGCLWSNKVKMIVE